MSVVRVQAVTSAAAFAAVFADHTCDALLLCYEGGDDAVHSADVDRLQLLVQRCVDEATREQRRQQNSNTLALPCVRVYAWDCRGVAFAAARQQLQKLTGWPLLLVVHDGGVADTLRARALSQLLTDDGDVVRVCRRLLARQGQQQCLVPSSSALLHVHEDDSDDRGARMSVDVARILHIGQTQLQRGQAVYAAKIFAKAVALLDAVHDDVHKTSDAQHVTRAAAAGEDNKDSDDTDAYTRSLAMSLAWAAMAELIVQSTAADDHGSNNNKDDHDKACVYFARLRSEAALRRCCREPLSDANRACAFARLLRHVQPPWHAQGGKTTAVASVTQSSSSSAAVVPCGCAALAARLRDAPDDVAARSHYVIALFLAGDVERALTEALKLRVSGVAFGDVALHTMTRFLGREHTLVQQLGLTLRDDDDDEYDDDVA